MNYGIIRNLKKLPWLRNTKHYIYPFLMFGKEFGLKMTTFFSADINLHDV